MGIHVSPLLFEEQHLVRHAELNDAIAFVGLDLCRVLGIRDHHQALERLEEDERGRCIIPTPSGDQEMIMVTEAGAYRLVFTSRKPVAERFKRWLAHEVIPAIRRDGFYDARRQEAAPSLQPEQRPFPDWPMEELRTKKGVVDMYRLLYGVMAAQWVSPQMGFPPPPPELVEHGRQTTLTFGFPSVSEAA